MRDSGSNNVGYSGRVKKGYPQKIMNPISWLILVIVILFFISGCSSAPSKILMKNCENIYENYYKCEEIPDLKVHEPRSRP